MIEIPLKRRGLVYCDECAYLSVQNTKYLYAICQRHGIEFKPFEDDTRTHYCAWGVKAEQTEPSTEEKAECPFDDKIPCEWVCPNSTDCSWK